MNRPLRAKTVQLFLMDGTTQGRMKASLSNWTGVAYRLPRTELQASKERADLQHNGVYLLFGMDDDGNPTVYVGQARKRKNDNGVLGRIFEHLDSEKLYWSQAVALVTANDTLGPTEISYLENRFTHMARAAGRYRVANSNDPSPGSPTEEKQAELEEFISYARIVIGVLGFRVFEPVDEAKAPEASGAQEPLLHMEYAGAKASGRQTSDGFVVLAGAQLRPENAFTKTAPEAARKNRVKYTDLIRDDLTLTGDALFASPSGAAVFVGGASLNGFAVWKDDAGRTLKEIEETS
ncbi:MAG: GIY-YIG nuclease family protein [Actinomycetaceae bacterium]|nr:GIY-YIG nuclease family protein [Actinomycetaceae bacterium]